MKNGGKLFCELDFKGTWVRLYFGLEGESQESFEAQQNDRRRSIVVTESLFFFWKIHFLIRQISDK